MADGESFGAGAVLQVEVDRASLRHTRDVIQDAVGDLEVGVRPIGMSPELRMGGSSSIGSGDASLSIVADELDRHGERRSKEAALARRLASEQVDILGKIWETLDDVAHDVDGMGEGMFGGVTDILLETGAETAGGLATEIPGILSDAIGPILGEVVGNVLSDYLSEGGASETKVEKPSWVPLKVEPPGDVDVNKPDWKVGVKDPSPLGVDDPSPLTVSDPSPLGVDDPSPLQVEDVPPIPVEDVPPIDVNLDIGVSGGAGGGDASSGETTDLPENTNIPGPGPVETVVDTASFGAQQGASAGMGAGPLGTAVGAVGGGAFGAIGGSLSYGYRFGSSILGDTANYGQPTNSGGGGGQTTGVNVTVSSDSKGSGTSIDYNPTYNVNADVDRIIREVKQAHKQDIRSLESEIESLNSDIDRMKRSLGGR